MLTKAAKSLLVFGLLCLPTIACAEETHVYEFREGQVNATWEGIGPIGMQKLPTGILLYTQNDTGALVTDVEPAFLADAGAVVLTSEQPGRLSFVWVYTGYDDPDTNALPVEFDASQGSAFFFSFAHTKQWYAGKKRIGIVLPPHTTILLHRIELVRWNLLEKGMNAFTSFWIPDRQRPYSINFVWGPQIEFVSADVGFMYDSLPPKSRSATMIAYGILLVTLVVMFGFTFITHRPMKKAVRWSFLLLAGMWILFDVRMGSEFLAWTAKDIRMYSSAEPGTRMFRDREHFYDFADFAKPFVSDRSSYVFFAQAPWPYLGNMRYLTYPSIPGNAMDTDDTWVIFDRPDLSLDAEGRISSEGRPVSLPGTILGRFDAGSFVFRTLLPPPKPIQP